MLGKEGGRDCALGVEPGTAIPDAGANELARGLLAGAAAIDLLLVLLVLSGRAIPRPTAIATSASTVPARCLGERSGQPHNAR